MSDDSSALTNVVSLKRRLSRWAVRVGVGDKLVFALMLAAVAGGGATYAALRATPPFGNDPNTIIFLLTLDLVVLLSLGALIARRIVGIWLGRRQGLAGSKLHVRLVTMLGLLAVTPAIVVAAFSAFFFFVGVQSWFSDKVRTAVGEAQQVAQAYLHEHQQVLRGDALSMANDLNRDVLRLSRDPQLFNQIVDTQAALRELSEAIVVDGSGHVLARSGLSFTLELERIPDESLEKAAAGEVVMFQSDDDDRVRALVRLDRFMDTYLYVGRLVEPRVLSYVKSTNEAASAYSELEGKRSGLQVRVLMIYIVVALLMLMVAVWYGLNFATQLVRPISALIAAAERVRGGDLSARVNDREDDELGTLSRAFNRMTNQLESQRRDLVEVNQQLDLRRRFTEAVLEGVTSGVVGLDENGVINLLNTSAGTLLDSDDLALLIGQPLTHLIPDFAPLFAAIQRRPSRLVEEQIQVHRPQQPPRTLLVRVVADTTEEGTRGFVVTFDDVSELLSAQRKAAWADVARRIAHEIKNPLTPIQLSAERLRRRYLKEITTDPDTFQQCTDTIVRQVDDIRRMVDEFSAFARMPQPVMQLHSVTDLCKQAVFLQASARTDVHVEAVLPPAPVTMACDARQLSQVLTNLLQNALDAIEGRDAPPDGQMLPKGDIRVQLTETETDVAIAVVDNGRGLPVADRDRLTEPYVTTRAKGTGLGLAIVKKIMEDHGGTLTLADNPTGGAIVTLIFPKDAGV